MKGIQQTFTKVTSTATIAITSITYSLQVKYPYNVLAEGGILPESLPTFGVGFQLHIRYGTSQEPSDLIPTL